MRTVLKQKITTICEAAATGSAMLLLPAAVMDLIFGSSLLDLLSPMTLLVAAIAAIVIGAQASLTAGSD
jgi:hypothetical protein